VAGEAQTRINSKVGRNIIVGAHSRLLDLKKMKRVYRNSSND